MTHRLIIIAIAWLAIPTGTPDDVFTLYIIRTLGPTGYIVLLAIIIGLLWHYKITPKKIAHTMGQELKKLKKAVT